jgi:hypothetical protein
VFIAGPYEFVGQDEDNSEADRNAVTAMAQAFSMLGYDAGYLAPEESDLLRKEKVENPARWRSGKAEAATEVLAKNGVAIGLVYFPFPAQAGQPSKEDIDSVLQKAAKLRQEANLVVGVSPWGLQAETQFLELDKAAGAFDILLGGGPGSGSKGRLAAGDRTVWVRPFSKGRAVNVVTVLDVPAKNAKVHWKENENIRFDITPLKDDIATDPKVDSLFDSLQK